METLLTLFCIAGLAFAVKELEGPFGLLSKLRNLLSRLPLIGTTIFHLLSCNFCLGLWCSAAVYLVTNPFNTPNFSDFMVWTFGGAMFNSVFSKFVENLNK